MKNWKIAANLLHKQLYKALTGDMLKQADPAEYEDQQFDAWLQATEEAIATIERPQDTGKIRDMVVPFDMGVSMLKEKYSERKHKTIKEILCDKGLTFDDRIFALICARQQDHRFVTNYHDMPSNANELDLFAQRITGFDWNTHLMVGPMCDIEYGDKSVTFRWYVSAQSAWVYCLGARETNERAMRLFFQRHHIPFEFLEPSDIGSDTEYPIIIDQGAGNIYWCPELAEMSLGQSISSGATTFTIADYEVAFVKQGESGKP